jgi:CIC family chloride channel protein
MLNYLLPGYELNPLIFVTAGMAGIVGSSTGLIVTAVLLIFEVTRDYTEILPIIMTVAISCVVRMKLCNETIFTLKLHKQGFFVSEILVRK